jgi:type I restriction enzyme S subunit
MSATLEAIARALFKSWFVDFDPVRAKAEGRNPGLPAEIAALFPNSLAHEGSRPIPMGWAIARLDDFANISGGKQLPTHECKKSGKHQVFGANGVMGYADRYTHDSFVAAFGRVGANCGSIHWTYEPSWTNNNASAIVPERDPEYVLQTLLEIDFVSMRTGSAQPFIPNSSLAAAPILRAPNELISEFCSIARPMRLRQGTLDAESRTLAAMRDALLPKLISGELRVGEAERVLAASK